MAGIDDGYQHDGNQASLIAGGAGIPHAKVATELRAKWGPGRAVRFKQPWPTEPSARAPA